MYAWHSLFRSFNHQLTLIHVLFGCYSRYQLLAEMKLLVFPLYGEFNPNSLWLLQLRLNLGRKEAFCAMYWCTFGIFIEVVYPSYIPVTRSSRVVTQPLLYLLSGLYGIGAPVGPIPYQLAQRTGYGSRNHCIAEHVLRMGMFHCFCWVCASLGCTIRFRVYS